MKTAAARERAVWRDFRQAQGEDLQRGGWENPVEGSWSLMLLMVLLLLIGILDEGTWSKTPIREHPVLGLEPPLWLFLASLFVLPVNGWRAHMVISLRTPRDRERPAWLRVLRFAAACLLPLGSFLAILQWRDLLRTSPSWAAPATSRALRIPLREGAPALPTRRFLERLCRSKKFANGLLVASLFPFCLGLLLLLHAEGESARRVAVAASIVLHVITFFSAAFVENMALRRRQERLWKWSIRALRWTILVPFPSVWMPGGLFLLLAAMGRTRRTVIGDLYSLHTEARRHPPWRRVELGQAPLRARLGEDSRASSRRSALSRITILLLAPEAGWLTWLLAAPGGRGALLEPVLVPALVAAVVLLFLGLLLQGLPPIARLLRWERIETAWTPYLQHGALLLPASLFLGGCAGGLLAAKGEVQTLGVFVELAASIILLVGVLYMTRAASAEIRRLDLWLLPAAMALYVPLSVLGRGLKVDPELAGWSVLLLQAIPFLHLFAGLALLPALLRPFTCRLIFDRRCPGSFRAVLAILSLTAILPLGGLAAPFWIWARQRLWMRYESTISATH